LDGLERNAAIAAATAGSRVKNMLHKYEKMHIYEERGAPVESVEKTNLNIYLY
jgi:hypothetical protein